MQAGRESGKSIKTDHSSQASLRRSGQASTFFLGHDVGLPSLVESRTHILFPGSTGMQEWIAG